ncbi:MAG: carboxymethylenebutenolidase [Candidatus Latescibacterota bacterium]|jgi:carboxymethylenebutenolidase
MYNSIKIDVQDSPMQALVFLPKNSGPHPGLVIAQHLPIAHAGLEKDPFTIDVGNRYAEAGYACIIPFLFHWWPADEDIEVKRAEFRDDRTSADLRAAYDALAATETVDGESIGILGHCWGGRVAWLGATSDPRYKASALFYGGRVKVPFADGGPAPIELAEQIQCPVLGVFGNEDQNPSPEDVNDYEAALKNANVSYQFHRYDNAGHGFQDHHKEERYRREQSEDAWGKAIAFFDEYLK